MVKLTIVGRVKDGLPLAQGPVYVNEDNGNFLRYKQQAEFILKQISAGSLPYSNTTILVDQYCFNYLVENGVCFITLCDSSYPRKLVFHYLQDLLKEFDKFDISLIHKIITRPYSFVKFDGVIRNIGRQYIDTRTQANLSKLNSKQQKEIDIITLHMSQILETQQTSELPERMQETSRAVSPIWSSPRLEVIALKWTPITIIVVVVSVILWASLILSDDFIILSF